MTTPEQLELEASVGAQALASMLPTHVAHQVIAAIANVSFRFADTCPDSSERLNKFATVMKEALR